MKKSIFLNVGVLLLAIFLFSTSGMAQRKITGFVQDATTNLPLDGATVSIQNSQTNTLSKEGGKFEITAPNGRSILSISFVGYETRTITVGTSSNNVVIKLSPSAASALNEVVVVGYGTKKKVDLTGAISTVSSKEIESRPIASTQQALQGLVPNLNITVSDQGGEPGGSMKMNIRGLQSFSGSNAPYVLVDGVPMDINSIDPNTIESISVLKDAASAAIYGARAAYGVILITTKSGKNNNRGANISYTANMDMAKPVKWPKLVGAMDFALAMNDAAKNVGGSPWYNADALDRLAKNIANPGSAPTMYGNANGQTWNIGSEGLGAAANTDWYDIFFKKFATHQSHSLSVSGSNEKVDYYLSAGLYNDQGLLRYGHESFDRYNFNGKINVKATSWAKVSVLFKYNYGQQLFPWQLGLGRGRIYDMMTKIKPTMPAKYPGTDIWTLESRIEEWQADRDNTTTRNMIISPRIIIEPIKGWVTNLDFNYTQNNDQEVFLAKQYFWVQPNGQLAAGNAQANTTYNPNINTNSYLSPNLYTSYTRSFGKHNLAIMAGYQQEAYNYFDLSGTAGYLLSDNVPSVSTAVGTKTISDAIGHWATQSAFGRLNYNYDDKYLLEANVRADGSSRFEPGKQWGTFPSVSGGWVASKEKFFPLKNEINFFKVRASYGALGNQNVDNYLYVPTLPISQSNYLFGGDRLWTVGTPNLSSVNLTWEKVNTTDLGTDFSLLKNHLSGSFDWYQTYTTNLVGPGSAVPALLGTGVPKQNDGEVRTRGFELEFSWKDHVGNFYYEVGGNLSNNRSVVTKYNNPNKILSTYYEGEVLGELWGYKTAGLFQTTDEVTKWVDQSYIYNGKWNPGDVKYVDLNGDKKIGIGTNTLADHGDKTIIGNTLPQYLYAFHAGASWKGIDLYVLFQGVAKQTLWLADLYNGAIFRGPANGPFHAMVYQGQMDYWRDASSPLGANPNAYYPAPYSVYDGANHKNYGNPTDRYSPSGAYLRLKNLRLGYTIPEKISQKALISHAQIYLSGENLLVFSKFKLLDPEEVGGRNGDGRTYPLSKSYSLGLNINF
ncbi:SusC/RagA family TonB-linked outer membrane protein [Ginsengibacter hankyongi]|nr:TonB-dependent receptor [Ginsengibacter hankyongi]